MIVAAAVALLLLLVWAPDYLFEQGFPLDESWVNMAYGRSFATSMTIGLNPAEPTNATVSAPWVWVLAALHHVTWSFASLLVSVKLLGFLFHVLTAFLVYRVTTVALDEKVGIVTGLVVAGHPDLVVASVSGIPVAFTNVLLMALLYAALSGRSKAFVGIALVLVLARPSLALVVLAAPLVRVKERRNDFFRVGLAAVLVAWALIVLRSILIAGSLPPALSVDVAASWLNLSAGLTTTLILIPLADATLVLAGVVLLWWHDRTRGRRPALQTNFVFVCLLGGLVQLLLILASTSHEQPFAFRTQWAIGHALPLIGVVCVWGASRLLNALDSRVVWIAMLALMIVVLVVTYAERSRAVYNRLASDAHNVDDLFVRIGLALSERDVGVVWTTRPGAVRYFGNAHIVDLTGRHTPVLESDRRDEYLAQHRPAAFVVAPGLAGFDPATTKSAMVLTWSPTTPYSLSADPRESTWALVSCQPGSSGQLVIGADGTTYPFICAGQLDQ